MRHDWRQAHDTAPPTTYEVPREIDRRSEEIRLRLGEQTFGMPSDTRLYRVGKTQEGLLVEFQDAAGAWHHCVARTSAPPTSAWEV